MFSLLLTVKQMPLVRRITSIALLCASVLSGLVIFAVYWFEFQHTSTQVESCITEKIDDYYTDLSESIWRREQLNVHAVLAKVEEHCRLSQSNTDQYFWSLNLKEDEGWFSRGENLLKSPLIELNFPLSYWEGRGVGQYGIGELKIQVSLRRLYEDLASKGWSIYLLVVFVLVLSCLLAMALGYRWFVKRSNELVERALTGEISENLKFSLNQERTEITRLWDVILQLRGEYEQRIELSKAELHRVKQECASAESDLAAKKHMVASLSHELRTPMNGLIGFVSLLSETSLSQEQKEYVATIQASLESLLYVINDVSDLSRFESGDLQIDHIPFCIRSLFSGISALLIAKAEHKGIQLETRIDPKVPGCLLGDPSRIRKLLSTLVFNAIEYSEQGQILVVIDLLSESNTTCILRLSVEDSGVGIDQRWLFSNASNVPSDGAHPAAQFRLDTTERLAQLLGSEVCYSSNETATPSDGVTAWLDLEFAIAPERTGGRVIDRSVLEKLQIIVLDESELSRKVALEIMDEWGVPIHEKHSVPDVLKLIPLCIEDRFTVVLLDDTVKHYDALTAITQLNTLMENRGAIVVTSATPMVGDAERYFLAGAHGYLVKSDRDLYLKDIICQVYIEREFSVGKGKRLITRHSVAETQAGPCAEGMIQKRALLVEENMVNQQFLARELEKRAYVTDVATSGFEAIELFKHHQYQMVFVNCWLNDMDGYQTVQLMRDLEASRGIFEPAPIIGLTNQSDQAETERCARAGMSKVLKKPVNLSHLELVLESYLD